MRFSNIEHLSKICKYIAQRIRTFASGNQYDLFMGMFYFADTFNLPNVDVRSLDDVIKHVFKTFKTGFKYYFTCEAKGNYYDSALGKTFPFMVTCRSFPMTGGKVSESIIGYSDESIPANDGNH